MEGSLRIRTATPDDVLRLAHLTGILGYPVAAEALRPRLERLLDDSQHVLLVAEVDLPGIVGWIHGAEQILLEADRRCEILGLVVAPEGRRCGVGRRLVGAIEDWARARGLRSIVVRSNITRAESHPFYERLAYAPLKTQHVYQKTLPADSA